MARLLEEIKVTWELFDQDGDGCITTEELRHVFAKLNLNLGPEQIDRMIKVADVNSDGEISYEEFVEAFHSRQWKEARAQPSQALTTTAKPSARPRGRSLRLYISTHTYI